MNPLVMHLLFGVNQNTGPKWPVPETYREATMLGRAILILRHHIATGERIRAVDFAGMHRANVFNALMAMVETGFVERAAYGNWKLTMPAHVALAELEEVMEIANPKHTKQCGWSINWLKRMGFL